MKTEKLEAALKALRELGHIDVEVYYEDGRDGKSALTPVVSTLKQMGTKEDPSVALVFYREG